MKHFYLIKFISRWLLAVSAVVVLANESVRGQRVIPMLAPAEHPADETGCGTTDKYSTAEVRELPWFGNNQFLVDFLRERGVAIAPDYMTRLMTGEHGVKAVTDASHPAQRTSAELPKVVPVQVWIYHNDNGTGGVSRTQVETDIRVLNAAFARSQVPVRFVPDCIFEDVNSTYFYDHPSDVQIAAAWLLNHRYGMLNLHYMDLTGRLNGIASLPRSAFVLGTVPTAFNLSLSIQHPASTVPHEVGHTLGLYHTHEGGVTLNDSNEDCSGCYQESVSRNRQQEWYCFFTQAQMGYKAEVNGDFLTDTPADPKLTNRVNTSCSYNGGSTDIWGDPWRPSAANIMSYAPANCRNGFTPLQAGVMRYWADRLFNAPANLGLNSATAVSCAVGPVTVTATGSAPGTGPDWDLSEVPATWGAVFTSPSTLVLTPPAGFVNNQFEIRAWACGLGFASAPIRAVSPNALQISIAGPPRLAVGQSDFYTVIPSLLGAPMYASALSYQWQAPPGWTIDNPNASTTGITANPTDASGDVLAEVYYCGFRVAVSTTVYVGSTQPPCPHPPCDLYPELKGTMALPVPTPTPVLRVYPNPASGYLFVESNAGSQGAEVELLNWQGQAVARHSLDDAGRVRLPLADLPTGLYLVRLWMPGDAKMLSQKVQIN